METLDFSMYPLPNTNYNLCKRSAKEIEAWEGIRISVLKGRSIELGSRSSVLLCELGQIPSLF